MARDPIKSFSLTKPEKEQLVKRLQEALKTHPSVVFAFLFGSFLEEGPLHDLDLAVYLDASADDPLETLVELWEDLASKVELPVDLCLLNDAPLAFRYNATRGRLLYVRDNEAEKQAYRFMERTWDEFFDFQPVMERYIEEMAHA